MPTVTCANCQTQFEKRPDQISRYPNHFCSRSCAAQVNNRLSPKRSRSGACRTCGCVIPSDRSYCPICWQEPKRFAETVTTKICPRCGQSKLLGEFYEKTGARDETAGSRQNFCKGCFNAYCVQRWKDRKVQAVAYLGGQCQDCGNVFHPNVYDFHHLRDKDVAWNKLRLRSWKRIQEELDKCALLCANCHRMRHVGEN